MFWFKTFITFLIFMAVLLPGVILQRQLATKPHPQAGYIAPILAMIVAMVWSARYFMIVVQESFSPLAFAAVVALFVFYMTPSIVLFFVFRDERQRYLRRRRQRRDESQMVKRRMAENLYANRPQSAQRSGNVLPRRPRPTSRPRRRP